MSSRQRAMGARHANRRRKFKLGEVFRGRSLTRILYDVRLNVSWSAGLNLRYFFFVSAEISPTIILRQSCFQK
jgi:hypothetical protein